MESHKLPWWIGFPASIGLSVMGIVAPTFLPIWAQAALFGAGAVAVIWSVFAGIWHWRRKPRTPSKPQTRKRGTELAAEEINRAVQLAGTPQQATPMADVFALPFKHMLEQTAAQLEAQHAKKLGEIRNEKPAPQRDVILPEALAYAEFKQWGRTFFEAASSAQNHANEQLEKFRQIAHDGALTVWGKRTEGGVFQIIPKEHWLDHNVEWFDLLRGKGRSEKVTGSEPPMPYSELMVCKAEFEREWPHRNTKQANLTPLPQPRRANPKKERQRELINQGRDIAVEYTREAPAGGFRAYLESQRAYADIRPHLSEDYRAKLNAQRTFYAQADGARYETLVQWFLDDVDRLEKEWGLT